jgi:hypothetical protein
VHRKEEKKKKVNCILIIKATHIHTVRCTQIRQMRENKYRCIEDKENELNNRCIVYLLVGVGP